MRDGEAMKLEEWWIVSPYSALPIPTSVAMAWSVAFKAGRESLKKQALESVAEEWRRHSKSPIDAIEEIEP